MQEKTGKYSRRGMRQRLGVKLNVLIKQPEGYHFG